ncbi:MAG: DinB family protein [Candidatus Angelobacter sp.]
MSDQVPSLAFADLLAYTDFLAQRWLNYFERNPAALDVNVGGRTPTLRDLVTHIFQVEQFFADLLLHEGAGATRRPDQMASQSLEELRGMHQEAHKKLAQYVDSTSNEALQRTRTLGPVTVSNRKTLTQALLHSVHHWAQVAMEVRQAGFPTEKPQDIIASPVMK